MPLGLMERRSDDAVLAGLEIKLADRHKDLDPERLTTARQNRIKIASSPSDKREPTFSISALSGDRGLSEVVSRPLNDENHLSVTVRFTLRH
jgi:hypothetical protein